MLAAITLLVGCGKSDEWHVGYCAAGMVSEMPQISRILSGEQLEQSLTISSRANGLDAKEVIAGYQAYKPGEDYTASCKISKKLEQKG